MLLTEEQDGEKDRVNRFHVHRQCRRERAQMPLSREGKCKWNQRACDRQNEQQHGIVRRRLHEHRWQTWQRDSDHGQENGAGNHFEPGYRQRSTVFDVPFIQSPENGRQQRRQNADRQSRSHFGGDAANDESNAGNDGDSKKQFAPLETPADDQRLDKRDEQRRHRHAGRRNRRVRHFDRPIKHEPVHGDNGADECVRNDEARPQCSNAAPKPGDEQQRAADENGPPPHERKRLQRDCFSEDGRESPQEHAEMRLDQRAFVGFCGFYCRVILKSPFTLS